MSLNIENIEEMEDRFECQLSELNPTKNVIIAVKLNE